MPGISERRHVSNYRAPTLGAPKIQTRVFQQGRLSCAGREFARRRGRTNFKESGASCSADVNAHCGSINQQRGPRDQIHLKHSRSKAQTHNRALSSVSVVFKPKLSGRRSAAIPAIAYPATRREPSPIHTAVLWKPPCDTSDIDVLV